MSPRPQIMKINRLHILHHGLTWLQALVLVVTVVQMLEELTKSGWEAQEELARPGWMEELARVAWVQEGLAKSGWVPEKKFIP